MELKVFRDKIDKIDSDIVDLIKERMAIVKEVGLYKESVDDGCFIKSAREVDMMRDLVESLDGVIDKRVVFNIWRSLIVSANIAEQELEVFIYNPNKDAQLVNVLNCYYANLVKIKEINDIEEFLSSGKKGGARILALTSSVEGSAWQKVLDSNENLKVFAKIESQLYLLADKPVEKSQNDKFVFFEDGKLVESSEDGQGKFLGVFGVVDK